jgi:hypothetical protein
MQLLSPSFRCVPLGKLPPRLMAADASLWSFVWCRLCGAAPSTHQDQGLVTSHWPATRLPLAPVMPQKTVGALPCPIVYRSQMPWFPCGSRFPMAHGRGVARLTRPEGSLYHGLRSGRSKRMVREDKNFKRHFHPAAPAVRLRQQPLSPAALATSPARRDGLPQRRAARRGAAMRGLDRQIRMGEAEDLRVLRGRGPRDGPSGKAGGTISNGISQCEGATGPPRAAPAAQAARHQPPVLSVPCGAGLWPAGCRQGWPAAGAGRAGSPRAGVGRKGRLIFLYSALTPRLGNRPYVRVLPGEERFQYSVRCIILHPTICERVT